MVVTYSSLNKKHTRNYSVCTVFKCSSNTLKNSINFVMCFESVFRLCNNFTINLFFVINMQRKIKFKFSSSTLACLCFFNVLPVKRICLTECHSFLLYYFYIQNMLFIWEFFLDLSLLVFLFLEFSFFCYSLFIFYSFFFLLFFSNILLT